MSSSSVIKKKMCFSVAAMASEDRKVLEKLADRQMELRSARPRAASSMEPVLTSTTHGLASGKKLVSISE